MIRKLSVFFMTLMIITSGFVFVFVNDAAGEPVEPIERIALPSVLFQSQSLAIDTIDTSEISVNATSIEPLPIAGVDVSNPAIQSGGGYDCMAFEFLKNGIRDISVAKKTEEGSEWVHTCFLFPDSSEYIPDIDYWGSDRKFYGTATHSNTDSFYYFKIPDAVDFAGCKAYQVNFSGDDYNYDFYDSASVACYAAGENVVYAVIGTTNNPKGPCDHAPMLLYKVGGGWTISWFDELGGSSHISIDIDQDTGMIYLAFENNNNVYLLTKFFGDLEQSEDWPGWSTIDDPENIQCPDVSAGNGVVYMTAQAYCDGDWDPWYFYSDDDHKLSYGWLHGTSADEKFPRVSLTYDGSHVVGNWIYTKNNALYSSPDDKISGDTSVTSNYRSSDVDLEYAAWTVSNEDYIWWTNDIIIGDYLPHASIDSINPNPAGDGETVYFSGSGWDPDGWITGYKWESDLEGGVISTQSSFSKNDLSTGVHTISFKVKDSSNHWSSAAEEELEIANQPPYTPKDPSPSDGATKVITNLIVTWDGGDPDGDPVTYDVYFGTTNPPPKVVSNKSETHYISDPDLDYDTMYYWKIVSWDDHSNYAEGPIWRFTTKPIPYTVFTPVNHSDMWDCYHRNESSPWGLGFATATSGANDTCSGIGGYVCVTNVGYGGGMAEASAWQNLTFYTGSSKELDVTVDIYLLHGESEMGGVGETNIGHSHNGGNVEWGIVVDPVFEFGMGSGFIMDIVELLTSIIPGTIGIAISLISIIVNYGLLFSELDDYFYQEEGEKYSYNFDISSSQGYNTLSIGAKTGASIQKDSCNTKLAFGGQITKITIDGIAPPGEPVVGGPTSGYNSVSYEFSAVGYDSNGDQIQYGWDWNGDGNVDEWTGFENSNTPVYTSHAWNDPGEYTIKVKSRDIDLMESDFVNHDFLVKNRPPEKPTIEGTRKGSSDTEYDYDFVAVDPDGDDIFYYIKWGDGKTDGWLGPYDSGYEKTVDHEWDRWGVYSIQAQAKDIHGAESNWTTKEVVMSKSTGCVEGTKINMAVGSPESIKNIEDIIVGDYVSSYDTELQVVVPAEVVAVHTYTISDEPINVSFSESNIKVAPNLLIYINQTEWMEASDIGVDYYLLKNTEGTNDTSLTMVTSIHELSSYVVYDLELQPLGCGNISGYFAGGGILVGERIPPEITNVLNAPDAIGLGFNVTIIADVNDTLTDVDKVKVNITYPDSSTGNFTMSNTGDTYEYVFNDTWLVGQYNYTIWARDNASNSNISSGHSFNTSHLFGYTEIGRLSQSVHDRIAGSVFTANEYGAVNNITAYINQDFMSPGPYKCMIYRLNDSKLIGTTTDDWEPLYEENTSSGWAVFNNFTELAVPFVEKNTSYIAACCGENEYSRLYYDVVSQSNGRYDAEIYGTPPDPASFSNENKTYSIYCSYTTDTTSPEITNVSSTPTDFDFTINADVTDTLIGVNVVSVCVTYPDSSIGNFTMKNTTGDTYEYVFNDTWLVGQYNYTIWGVDNAINGNSSSEHNFNVSANATISGCVINDMYGDDKIINITDPPPEEESDDESSDDENWWVYPEPQPGQIFAAPTFNWTKYWSVFKKHAFWSLEGWNPVTEQWEFCNDSLTVEVTNVGDNGRKLNLIFDAPAPITTDYRLTLAIDYKVKQYIHKVDKYTYNLSFEVHGESFNVSYNFSDIANIPGIIITHDVKEVDGHDYFWFMARKNNVSSDAHVELDPTFSVFSYSNVRCGYPHQRKLVRQSNGNGNLWCTYDENYDVHVASSDDGGATWNDIQIWGSQSSRYSSLAVDSNDVVHLVFQSYKNDPNDYQLEYSNSTNWNNIVQIRDEDKHHQYPAIAVDSNDNLHIVYMKDEEGVGNVRQIAYVNSMDNGGSWGTEQILTNEEDSGDAVFAPSIAINNTDVIHVVYFCRDHYSEKDDILHIQSSDYGDTWTDWEADPVYQDSTYDQWSPCIAIDDDDNLHVVWYGASQNTNDQIGYSYNDSSGWSDVEWITWDPAEDYQLPSVSVNDNLHVHSSYDVLSKKLNHSVNDTNSWSEDVIFHIQMMFSNMISTQYPTIDGLKTNRPKTGYALISQNVEYTNITYHASSDLTWDTHQINTSIDDVVTYCETSSPFNITATGDSNLDNVTLWYRYSADNSSWPENWWNNSWNKRVPINLSVFYNETEKNHTVLLNISYDSDMKNDFGDLRFIRHADNETVLDYCVESQTNENWCNVWVELRDNITTADQTLAWMYYCNPTAVSKSNGDDTFLFFDSFAGSTLDANKWPTQVGDITVNFGRVHLNFPDSSYAYAQSNSLDYPGIIEFRCKYTYDDDIARFCRFVKTHYGGTYFERGIHIWDDSDAHILNANDPGIFHTYKIVKTSTNALWYFDDIYKFSRSIPGSIGTLILGNNNEADREGDAWFDYIFIRKLSLSETSYLIGSEQTCIRWKKWGNPDTSSPWSWNFDFPDDRGYYEFYSVGKKSGQEDESPPVSADALIHFADQSKIKNVGSSNMRGYLLMNVQYNNSGEWIVDTTVVNNTYHIINSSEQLALDQFFNDKVNSSNLSYGNGMYRVYAAFRDLYGNVWVCDDGSKLEAWWEFEVDTS